MFAPKSSEPPLAVQRSVFILAFNRVGQCEYRCSGGIGRLHQARVNAVVSEGKKADRGQRLPHIVHKGPLFSRCTLPKILQAQNGNSLRIHTIELLSDRIFSQRYKDTLHSPHHPITPSPHHPITPSPQTPTAYGTVKNDEARSPWKP